MQSLNGLSEKKSKSEKEELVNEGVTFTKRMKDVKVVDQKGIVSLIQVPIEEDEYIHVSKEDAVAVVDEMVDNGFISDKEAKKLKDSLGETYDQIMGEGGIMGIEEKESCECGGNCGNGKGMSNMGQTANKGFARDDSSTSTRLLDKMWSPLIVRKYYVASWPLYVGIISDCNLNDLDTTVLRIIDEAQELGFLNGNIQDVRNFCGFMSDQLDKHYDSIKKGSVEGLGIAWYVDKMMCSSLSKDMMVHKSCRDEFYSILKVLPHI